MDTVIAAFENPKFGRQVGELLEGAGVAQVLPCSSGDQVRRLLQRQGAGCVICGPHLTDGPSEWLCGDLPPSCLLLMVGLRDWEREEIKTRQEEYGIRHVTPEEVREDSGAVLAWLRACGASKVVVHFDLDVLDPAEIIAAVGVVPGGMRMEEVARVINDISREKEIVGLTVAEPMPRTALRLKELLGKLPLLR